MTKFTAPGQMSDLHTVWQALISIADIHRFNCVASPTTSCPLCREEQLVHEQAMDFTKLSIENGTVGQAGQIVVQMYMDRYQKMAIVKKEQNA